MKTNISFRLALILMIFVCFPLHGCGADSSSLPYSYYGKVIDQYGNPIPDVKIAGQIVVGTFGGETGGDITKPIETETDAKGMFQFNSASPIVTFYSQGYSPTLPFQIKKESYIMDTDTDSTVIPIYRGLAFHEPNKENKTTQNDRGIFTMWKLQGPEPVYVLRMFADLPVNGESVRMDLLNRDVVLKDGDMIVSFKRTPENADSKTPYGWTLKVEMIHGGLREITDPYPYEAPKAGRCAIPCFSRTTSPTPLARATPPRTGSLRKCHTPTPRIG